MSSITKEIELAGERQRALIDVEEIRNLVDRYVTALDTADDGAHDDAWYESLFTSDVELRFPIGGHDGVAGLSEFQRVAKAKWALTHHLSGNHVVEIDGDRADTRAQVLATHVHSDETAAAQGIAPGSLFQVGGYYTAEAVRTPTGWRLRWLHFHVVWTGGRGLPSLTDAGT